MGLSESAVQKAAIILKYFAYNWACFQRKETIEDDSVKFIGFKGPTYCKITVKFLSTKQKGRTNAYFGISDTLYFTKEFNISKYI